MTLFYLTAQFALLILLCLLLVLIPWNFLTFLQDLIHHFATELLHVLVLELLDDIASHNFCADLLFLVTHHVLRFFRVPLLSELKVTVKLLLQSLLEIILFLERELTERAKSPRILHRDVFRCVVRWQSLHGDDT